MNPIFSDAIVQISVTGTLVRIDLGAVVMTTNQDGETVPQLRPTQQLVMPLEGFVRGFGVQQQAVNKLIADGVLKPLDQQQADAEQQPQTQTLAAAAPVATH